MDHDTTATIPINPCPLAAIVTASETPDLAGLLAGWPP